MCSAPDPKPPAAPVPVPAATAAPTVVTTAAQDPANIRRKGRSRLTIPSAGGSSTTGMSGLNIPT